MKRVIAIAALSTVMAIGPTGCAHQQLTNEQLARRAVKVAGIAGVITLMLMGVQRGAAPQY